MPNQLNMLRIFKLNFRYIEILWSAKYAFASSQGKERNLAFLCHLALLTVLNVNIKTNCQKIKVLMILQFLFYRKNPTIFLRNYLKNVVPLTNVTSLTQLLCQQLIIYTEAKDLIARIIKGWWKDVSVWKEDPRSWAKGIHNVMRTIPTSR